jgi:hypothetical protein
MMRPVTMRVLLVQPVMARSYLGIEVSSLARWSYGIFLEHRVCLVTRLATMSIELLGSLAACHQTRRSCKLVASYEGFFTGYAEYPVIYRYNKRAKRYTNKVRLRNG